MGANQIATGTITQIAEKIARHGIARSSRAGVAVTVVAVMSVALMRPSLSSLKLPIAAIKHKSQSAGLTQNSRRNRGRSEIARTHPLRIARKNAEHFPDPYPLHSARRINDRIRHGFAFARGIFPG